MLKLYRYIHNAFALASCCIIDRSVVLTIICLLAFSCRQDSTDGRVSDPAVNFCTLVSDKQSFENRRIAVRSNIYGYHQLVLFSNDCPGSENLVELHLLENEKRKLLAENALLMHDSATLVGKIEIEGHFLKGGGKVYFYPGRELIDDFDPTLEKHMLITGRLIEAKVIDFKFDPNEKPKSRLE